MSGVFYIREINRSQTAEALAAVVEESRLDAGVTGSEHTRILEIARERAEELDGTETTEGTNL